MALRDPHHCPAAGLSRLVNAVIWPGFVGATVPGWLDRALRDGLAGVVYFSHNIDPDVPGQLPALSAAIRAANPSAVVGVDEEGGNVTRLQSRGGSAIPGAAVLGALDDVEVTAAAGRAIGGLCRAAGVNLAIAPVADVNTNPLNPVIGVRAFGSSAALVSAHTAAAVAGIQAAGVGACAKHFPGHGDTVADSHLDVARVELTLAQLREHHLPPFQAAFDAGVAAVMGAHIVVPGLGDAPATLNPRAGALLRDLGFGGLLVTDALDMAAVRVTVGPGEGAVLALLAGADLLCVGNPLNAYTTGRDDEACYTEVFDAVYSAVSSGRLPVEVLQAAAGRVAAFVQWSQEASRCGEGGACEDGEVDWVDVAARACRVDPGAGAVALAGPDAVVTLVDARTAPNMAAGATDNFLATALLEGYEVCVPDVSLLSAEDLSDLVSAAASQGEPVLVLVDALSSPMQQATLAAVAAVAPRALCINAGLPPEPGTATGTALSTVHCHGFSRVSAEAVVRLLTPAR
ncbi:glycoside hydrolase family 3 N-terminal domain-containing protein [Arthrobacter sp. STN4]|uniref:glycoside hydrolase family 3 N-terminal domain-containing protein n=1 Tax=Arthrobacter sp. STN4 TaxID=2923276 RepID=UPI00211A210D|nr:glycoside hydrolase family 3 N-terminal domain-containing protein [Arthrobacter sp. STN4]MCQ9164875.1 glycoside hydrolase family 3 protein [Arthrobacter sp. STN4]